MLSFQGYVRENGRIGIRNAVLVISSDLCCNPWSIEIASQLENCYAITHKHGVGNYAPDRVMFKRIIEGITIHPNTAGFVYVSSGNEDHPPEELLGKARRSGVPFSIVTARNHSTGGSLIREAVVEAGRLTDTAAARSRVEIGIEHLVIGLNCAGTDIASAESVHPVLGKAVDMLTEYGATVVFTETPDLIGLDDALFDRCRKTSDRDRLIGMYNTHHERLGASGEQIDEIEMVAFNTEGGLESLKHKATVSILKAGTGNIGEVVEFGAPITEKGLVFMDGPAMTDFVMAGYMGSGVHLMINTCGAGEGNKMPFTVGADTPSPILPVIKMTVSSSHYANKDNCIDFCAGSNEGIEIEKRAEQLLDLIVKTASGQMTATEWGTDFLLNFPVKYHQA